MKAKQIDGGYDFFRCPEDGIAPKALALSIPRRGSNEPARPEQSRCPFTPFKRPV
jgi:hypothetical protein